MLDGLFEVIIETILKGIAFILIPIIGILLDPFLTKFTMLKYFHKYDSYKTLSKKLKKYVKPSFVNHYGNSIKKISYKDVLKSVRKRKGTSRFWVITGAAGFGKSTLLEQIFYKKSGNAITDRISPKNIIYYNLADIESIDLLEKKLNNESGIGKSTVLLLDAFDEFPYLAKAMIQYEMGSSYEIFKELVKMLKTYVPTTISRVIISTRPGVFEHGIEDLAVYKVRNSYPPELIDIFILKRFDKRQTLKLYKKIGGTTRNNEGHYEYKKGRNKNVMKQFLNQFEKDNSIFSIPFVVLFADDLFKHVGVKNLDIIQSIGDVYRNLIQHWLVREYNKYLQQELEQDLEISFEEFHDLVLTLVRHIINHMITYNTTTISQDFLEDYAKDHHLTTIDFITIIVRSFLRKTTTYQVVGRNSNAKEYEFMHQTLYEYFLVNNMEQFDFKTRRSLLVQKKYTTLSSMYVTKIMEEDLLSPDNIGEIVKAYDVDDKTHYLIKSSMHYENLLFADKVYLKEDKKQQFLHYFPTVSAIDYKGIEIKSEHFDSLYTRNKLDLYFEKPKKKIQATITGDPNDVLFEDEKTNIFEVVRDIFYDPYQPYKIKELYDLSNIGVKDLDISEQDIRIIKEPVCFNLLDITDNYVIEYEPLRQSKINELHIDVGNKDLLETLLQNKDINELHVYLMDYYRVYSKDEKRLTDNRLNEKMNNLDDFGDKTIELVTYLYEQLQESADLTDDRIHIKWKINPNQYGLHIEKRFHDNPEIALNYFKAYKVLKRLYKTHASMMFYLLKTAIYGINFRQIELLKEVYSELLYLKEECKEAGNGIRFVLFDISLHLKEYDVMYQTDIYKLDILKELSTFNKNDLNMLKNKVTTAGLLNYFDTHSCKEVNKQSIKTIKDQILTTLPKNYKKIGWDYSKLVKYLYHCNYNITKNDFLKICFTHRKDTTENKYMISNFVNYHFKSISYHGYKYTCYPDVIFEKFDSLCPSLNPFYSGYMFESNFIDALGLNDHIFSWLIIQYIELKESKTNDISKIAHIKNVYIHTRKIINHIMEADTWVYTVLNQYQLYFDSLDDQTNQEIDEYISNELMEEDNSLLIKTDDGSYKVDKDKI